MLLNKTKNYDHPALGVLCLLVLLLLPAKVLAAGLDRAGMPFAPSRIVIAIMENRPYSRIIGNPAAPYINSLARRGMLFTQSYGITHPSQPNYLALFSGSTQVVKGNECPAAVRGDNLAASLLRAGRSFAIYSEAMPAVGYTGCAAGNYQRKHNPVVGWQQGELAGGGGLPAAMNQPFSAFPSDPARLPTVSMVVPDQSNDMHDGRESETIRRGDAWLATHLDAYVRWADANNGLFILTFDEDDGSEGNRIVTLFTGAMVRPGTYSERIDHYRVLRTVLALYGLKGIGQSEHFDPIEGIWKTPVGVRSR